MEVPALSSALQGMARAEAQLNQAASDIARAPVAASGEDTVDLSAAMVALLQSRNNFEANTKMLKAVDEMDQALLNIIG
jgi:flagellar basal body rod protein FlgG